MSLKSQSGSSLIEALIALLILSISILGLIGLQANLLRIGSQAQYRLQASILAQNIAGLISVDATNVGCYALVAKSELKCPDGATQGVAQAATWRDEVLATLPNAKEPSIAVAANRTATITLSWKSPKDPATRNLVLVAQPIQ